VLVAEGERTPEFADLDLDQPPEPTSRAEPGAAADGEDVGFLEFVAHSAPPLLSWVVRDEGQVRRLALGCECRK